MTNFNFQNLDKEYTVSEISLLIRDLLEHNFNYIKIKGEISGLKIASSGHGYFNLKDGVNILACTCWRPVLAKIDFELKDGLEVVICGKITAYGGQSKYQISAQLIQPSGYGLMMKILQERKLKLAQEGLFDASHKKPLPFFPRRIGVITSITGAVIRDIIHRLRDRCPVHVIIWPVAVQGDSAKVDVYKAINGFNDLPAKIKPEVLIIARGGGSIEDLWAFNEEEVVRAAYDSHIPIISAIGHETDFTLLDYVADVRAPTPTAAAEFAVPVIGNIKYTLQVNDKRLQSSMQNLIKYFSQQVSTYINVLKYSDHFITSKQQKLDEQGFKLENIFNSFFNQNLLYVKHINLLSPQKLIDYKKLQISHAVINLKNILDNYLIRLNYQFTLSRNLLESLDYNQVLKRGFAIIKDQNDHILSRSSIAVKAKDILKIKFIDGEILVKKDTN